MLVFRQHHLKLIRCIDAHGRFLYGAFQQMASRGTILRNEMEVISRQVDAFDIGRTPEADDRPFYIVEFKSRLARGHIGKRRIRLLLLRDAAGLDISKGSVDPEGVKQVLARQKRVESLFQRRVIRISAISFF